MRKFIYLLLLFSTVATGQAQIGKFHFQNRDLDHQSILHGAPITDYYILLIEKKVDITLDNLYRKGCLEKGTDYYLLDISNLNLSDNDKELILVEFINYVEKTWLVSGTNIHIIMNRNRAQTYLKNLTRTPSSMQFKLIENLAELCNK